MKPIKQQCRALQNSLVAWRRRLSEFCVIDAHKRTDDGEPFMSIMFNHSVNTDGKIVMHHESKAITIPTELPPAHFLLFDGTNIILVPQPTVAMFNVIGVAGRFVASTPCIEVSALIARAAAESDKILTMVLSKTPYAEILVLEGLLSQTFQIPDLEAEICPLDEELKERGFKVSETLFTHERTTVKWKRDNTTVTLSTSMTGKHGFTVCVQAAGHLDWGDSVEHKQNAKEKIAALHAEVLALVK